jgi:hypothetical protein
VEFQVLWSKIGEIILAQRKLLGFMNRYNARFLKIAKFGLSGQIEMSIITFRTFSIITRSNHCMIDFYSDFLLFILDQ